MPANSCTLSIGIIVSNYGIAGYGTICNFQVVWPFTIDAASTAVMITNTDIPSYQTFSDF